jgi:hypothetical protein
MTDIVKCLRTYRSESWGSALRDTGDAADEIELLRAELAKCGGSNCMGQRVIGATNWITLDRHEAVCAQHDAYVDAAMRDIVERDDVIERLRNELAAEKAETFRLQCSHSALYNECAELRDARTDYDAACVLLEQSNAERDALRADALRADAVRYRWLRVNHDTDAMFCLTFVDDPRAGASTPHGDLLDAAIDAATAAQTQDSSEPGAV